ncbi:MAG: hypothetical protein ACYC9S_13670, partial [Leptospirales bacterium]
LVKLLQLFPAEKFPATFPIFIILLEAVIWDVCGEYPCAFVCKRGYIAINMKKTAVKNAVICIMRFMLGFT